MISSASEPIGESPLSNNERAEASALRLQALTERQRQVLGGMIDGLLNKQIASRLGIDEKTVKMHRAGLLRRLGALSSATAVRIGVEASFAPKTSIRHVRLAS